MDLSAKKLQVKQFLSAVGEYPENTFLTIQVQEFGQNPERCGEANADIHHTPPQARVVHVWRRQDFPLPVLTRNNSSHLSWHYISYSYRHVVTTYVSPNCAHPVCHTNGTDGHQAVAECRRIRSLFPSVLAVMEERPLFNGWSGGFNAANIFNRAPSVCQACHNYFFSKPTSANVSVTIIVRVA